MGDELIKSLFTVATAIVGVAILAVLVSRNSNTSGVLTAAGSAFSTAVGAAVSPVTGSGGMSSFGGFSGGAGFPSLSM